MSKFLPCPFCGGDNTEIFRDRGWPGFRYYRHCNNCGAGGPGCLTRTGQREKDVAVKVADELWNRARADAAPARRQALEEAAQIAEDIPAPGENPHAWPDRIAAASAAKKSK